jgi:protein-histidine N-methyltransferase
MVPLADMLNHNVPRQTAWEFTNKVNGFTITTLQNISEGDEIYDSYGRKCNTQLLANYGFALLNNDSNRCCLMLLVPSTDPKYALKMRYLGSPIRRFVVSSLYNDEDTPDMFGYGRLAVASDDELMLIQDGVKLAEVKAMSVKNEALVLQQIERSAKMELSRFATSLEDDNKIIADEKAWSQKTQAYKNCVIVRRGEKQVLHRFLELCKVGQEYLEMPWADVKRGVQRLYADKSKSHIHNYLYECIVPLKNPRQAANASGSGRRRR